MKLARLASDVRPRDVGSWTWALGVVLVLAGCGDEPRATGRDTGATRNEDAANPDVDSSMGPPITSIDDGMLTHPEPTDLGLPPTSSTGRQIARLTAGELRSSLEVATGQTWTRFEQAAPTLGRPDFVQSVVDDRQVNVVLERVFGEGVRQTCRDAINHDRPLATNAADRAILRGIDLAAPTEAARTANLQRLLLRFHGRDVAATDTATLAPWRRLLAWTPASGTPSGADLEAMRWRAVCVALATHADFVTY